MEDVPAIAPTAPRSIDVLVVAPSEPDIDDLVEAFIARRHVVERADTPDTLARDVVSGRPEVVVVDLRTGALGDRILSWVSRNTAASTLVITASDQTDVRIRALQLGASDHVVAPFETREATARVELLLAKRRAGRDARIEAGDLVVDVTQRAVTRNGEVVTLTPRELALLQVLVKRGGETVSKHDLLCEVWRGETRSENVVEANVSSLRRKLHGLGPAVIHTVHRSGYVFRPVTPSVAATRSTLVAERDRMIQERDAIIARRDEIIRRLRAERGDRSSS
jgi:two-component system OmpR family response regulator